MNTTETQNLRALIEKLKSITDEDELSFFMVKEVTYTDKNGKRRVKVLLQSRYHDLLEWVALIFATLLSAGVIGILLWLLP